MSEPLSKKISKKLSTGQTIQFSIQDDRTLKQVYDFISGYANRRSLEQAVEANRAEVNNLYSSLPQSTRFTLQLQPSSRQSNILDDGSNDPSNPDSVKNEADAQLDKYFNAKEELARNEERLKNHSLIDHKISFKDIDTFLKIHGAPFHKKQIEQMIWEVDENLDNLIDYDELQLTYYRNVTDTTGNEPCLFFKLLEFLIFDSTHKGYIIEDDCMEILYARYGGQNLEKEMKILFGNRLRAEGGDGTLDLQSFLKINLDRVGKRALVF